MRVIEKEIERERERERERELERERERERENFKKQPNNANYFQLRQQILPKSEKKVFDKKI